MATVCAISGELPQQPVISRNSGHVYEKRLIEAYITENGTEPTTGAQLTTEDLIAITPSHIVRPRAPELTSIPALLGAFQQEWDALALEVFTLQQNLAQTRQELSTALYQHDAAVRVVARLTQERDAAREALKNINATNGNGNDSMQIDPTPLPAEIVQKIETVQAGLMKTRRKRPVPAEWATNENISLFKPSSSVDTGCKHARVLAVSATNSALVGDRDGKAFVVAGDKVLPAGDVEGVTSGAWVGSRAAIGTANGKVIIVEQGQEVASFDAHNGAVTGLTLHTSGDILASVSADRSYVVYDLATNQVLTQVQTSSSLTCTAFHPDGHLLAAGGQNGKLQIFDVKSGAVGGEVELEGPAQALCFSENGTWLATATAGSSTVYVWDLRKLSGEGPVQTLTVDSPVESLDWDYSAQFLAVGSQSGISVKQYTKATKLWSEPLRTDVPGVAVRWGEAAQSLFSLDSAGKLSMLSSA